MGEAESSGEPTDTADSPLPGMAIAIPLRGDEQEPSPSGEEKPSWFSPKRLLMMFCVINMLNYVDRGVIASNGVNGSQSTCTESGICISGGGIQGDFGLSNFEDGVLSSAFMVGLLVASPIFASLAKSINPFRLIGVGLSVWTLATAGCGCAFDFWSITIFRMLVGVGEASFISLAAPFIDDNAPVSQKTAWLATFYMCIPSGIALGYVYGGVVGNGLHWRYAFWGEALLMLPFAIFGFLIKPLQLKGFSSSNLNKEEVLGEIDAAHGEQNSKHAAAGSSHDTRRTNTESKNCSFSGIVKKFSTQVTRFGRDIKLLLGERVYVINVLGYITYNFVIGAYSYWGPKAGQDIYHMNNADLMFGGITIVCGIFGTLAGGYILDRIQSTLSNAFKILSVATFLGASFCFGAFCFKSLYGFIALFSVGELLVFATQAPVNYVCLHSVNPSLRPLSMAMSTVSIHIFGDVPSSPLVGILQDHINSWRSSALILTSILFIASAIWFVVSSDDEIDYSIKPEFYDPLLDVKDEQWMNKQRKGRTSDAVLSCPACFTTLCFDCQRHEKYVTQYRAMFVVNCTIRTDQILREQSKSKRISKKLTYSEFHQDYNDNMVFHSVCCSVCSTEVGVFDKDEVFHFFNVIPSNS